MSPFWSGRRVLVTGHTGFKGAWLDRWLRRLGAESEGLSLQPSGRHALHRLIGDPRNVIGDVTDVEDVDRIVAGFAPEVVFHLAAQSLVGEGYRDPAGTFEANVMGTVRVLDAVRRRCEGATVLVVTTDKVYRPHDRAHVEADPMGGPDPYSASKAAAEHVVTAYRALGVRAVSARAGNVIGGGDRARERLVPDLVRAWERGCPLELRRHRAVRPWQHVLEPLHGYLEYARRTHLGEPLPAALNFGPCVDQELAVEDLVSGMHSALGGGSYELAQQASFQEADVLRLDSGAARSHLGWGSVLTAAEAVDWTAEWHRRVHDGDDPGRVTDEQIERYEERLCN